MSVQEGGVQRTRSRTWAGALGAAVLAAGAWADARACAVAPREGLRVEVAEESALIVWDPVRQEEHFIRRATFRVPGRSSPHAPLPPDHAPPPEPSFGFLVPTPTRPTLAQAPDAVFEALDRLVQPEVVRERPWRLVPTALCFPAPVADSRVSAESAAPRGVDVLERVKVSGYDAAVLAADDPAALAAWLKEHGYDHRPALVGWLERYVAAGWIITAFKVDGDATAPVRLTFSTDRPLYPYREPEDARAPTSEPPPRHLRVFLVAPERLQGTLGEAGAWPATLRYASPNPALATAMGEAVPALPAGSLWLHAFDDRSSPRPGTDEVFFARDPAQAPKLPPARVVVIPREVPIPIDLLVAVAAGFALILRWRRRRAGEQGA